VSERAKTFRALDRVATLSCVVSEISPAMIDKRTTIQDKQVLIGACCSVQIGVVVV
jgi:hypothetical protein